MNFSLYSKENIEKIAVMFSVDPNVGLLSSSIEERRKETGMNILLDSRVSPFKIFLRQFKSSFIYLLLFATVLSFSLNQVAEGIMILIFILINASLGFYQEYRSEQTVELLKGYVATRVKVRRDGKISTINASELVLGDIVILEAGDGVPADIRIIDETNFIVNEEPLTGESVSVDKERARQTGSDIELYEAKNICFSGTTVVSGSAVGIVFATGARTMIGGISKLAGEMTRVSQFELELARFSRFILYLVIGTLGFIFVMNIFLKGFSTNIVELAIFSIALAVSVVPEALPLVMTFSLSRGARRLAKKRVVVKRLSAIEDLGSIQMLCSDKTGTLTENKLTVHQTCGDDGRAAIFAGVLGGSYLTTKERGGTPDPFDVALWEALSQGEQARATSYTRLSDTPFDPIHKKNSVVVKGEDGPTLIVRGAHETIFASTALSSNEHERLLLWIKEEGRAGRRTLAIASKKVVMGDTTETGLTFIGCVSFIDPIKESARQAIKDAQKLGIKIKILTGDSREVAGTVAHNVGLAKSPNDVLTAREFFALGDEEREHTLENINVFARVSPEEKYKLIELLQKNYQVGFLGEGINDAPALKIANVAIAVASASDIAREVSDIILLERSLSVVIGGIREGRAIFANTIKYIRSSLSSNFGNFYSVAISSLFIPFLPMLAIQILLVNLLSDFPAIAIATDTADDAELREPKQYDVRKLVAMGTVLGIVSTVFDFIIFASFYKLGPEVLQTHWFMESILTELLFLFSIRSRGFFFQTKVPSLTLVVLAVLAAGATIIIPFTDMGASLFHFKAPTATSFGFVIGLVAVYFVTTEFAKIAYYRITSSAQI
ncbi:MAG: HAD-IC family P-type ATPase [Candidatus Yonathbacteria bacterium]|nr:HAD-IC family P-type ATPase [Candidatus Yonathbacteria bacterium]